MLRLLDRYLIREIVPYTLLALLLLTAIIFAHEGSRFSELLVVSSRNGLPMQALARVFASLIPGILVFTLPISLLIGTLVGLSRLSGDSEVVALGASGISRTRMLRPVVGLAVAATLIMLYVTFNLLPSSIENLSDLKANQALVFQGLNAQIKPRVFEESIPKKVLYIEDIDRANNIWHNIFLVDLGEDQGDVKIFTATSGTLRQGERSEMPELYLQQGSMHQTRETKPNQPADQEREEDDESSQREARLTASSLDAQPAPEKEKDKEKKKARQRNYTSGKFDDMTVGLEVSEEEKAAAVQDDQEEPQVREMKWKELVSFLPPEADYRKWSAEIHKRLALPAACIVFALLGVAFGISNVRTGRSLGLLIGLAITVCYYLLALSGEHAALSGKLPVWLGIWMANIILAALGALMIFMQRRPGSDAFSIFRRLRHTWLPGRKTDAEMRGRGDAETNDASKLLASSKQINQTDQIAASPRRRVSVSRMPQLIDRLVMADLTRFFFYILGGFSILFVIITLFQLLEYITRNNIEWDVVGNYLLFLLPMIVNYVTPLAALVAVMVTFGILQKTSQVVALKASGQSIYRLAAPVLLLSLVLSALVFLNQDYVLPFTNRRQNNLRYLIRRGQEPPQTFYQTTNQWIFGIDSRIYNYAHFDLTNNTFARLNVIDLSRKPFGIKRRLYARRASWDQGRQEWILENGWERKFEGERIVAYEPFKQLRVQLAEQPDYFKKDSRGSSSMTMAELNRKITDLSRSGFDVLDLKIALQSKIAFPLTCLIMVIVGLPFSFSVGKRGALYGVTLGIAIGLFYWGMTGLFEQMGRYEMLPPALAAWGPNMLFGAGGLYLFLTSRT
jgi:LPS export ABC transporter permease LptG